MFLELIRITNILGIDRLQVEPGKITEITGKNKAGKTSFLEALKFAVGGGHKAELLRNGCDEAEIVLTFDNGESLTKNLTKHKSTVTILDAKGKKINPPAGYLKDVIDSLGLNPIQILTASKKERVNLILDSVPMDPVYDEIKLITGLDKSALKIHPLKVIQAVQDMLFEDRKELKSSIKTTEGTIGEMQKTIPFQADKKDWGLEVHALRMELEDITGIKNSKVEQSKNNYQNSIGKFKDKAQAEIDSINHRLNLDLEEIGKTQMQYLAEILDRFNDDSEPLKQKIMEADINSKNQDRISGAENYVIKFKKEIKIIQVDVDLFSKQIKELDGLKAELLENLPVKDLSVKGDDIYIGGVLFDTLNEAAKR